MSFFRPKNVAIIGGVVCAGVFAVSRMGDLKTPGMRNIENRHSAAGGGHNYTPAGGSPMGQEQVTRGRQEQEKGVGTKYFEERHGDQKPEALPLGKKWNQAQYGSDSSKQ